MTKHILKTCGEDVQGTGESLRSGSHVNARKQFARLDVETGHAHARAVCYVRAREHDQHGRRAPMAWSDRQVVFNEAAEVLYEFLADEGLLSIRRHNGQPLLDEQCLHGFKGIGEICRQGFVRDLEGQ